MVKVYDSIIPDVFCAELISLFENSSDQQEYINNNHTPCFTQLNINDYHPNCVKNLVRFNRKAYGKGL